MAPCVRCGATPAPGAAFCSACGASMAAPAYTTLPAAPAPLAPHPATRPLGVTIVGVTMLVAAAFAILGAVMFAFVMMAGGIVWSEMADFPWGGGFFSMMGGILALFAVFALFLVSLVAAAAIATGIGVLRGANWAWVLTLVLMALNALGGIASLAEQEPGGLFALAVSGVVIWYFFRPEVKAWFART